jgi:hypothetical protein
LIGKAKVNGVVVLSLCQIPCKAAKLVPIIYTIYVQTERLQRIDQLTNQAAINSIGHRVKNFKFFLGPAALVGRASVPAKSSFCGSGFPAAIC